MTFYPLPNRPVRWVCPKCGKELIEKPNPWIHIPRIPLFFIRRAPVCPKCKTKMIEVKLF
ncbi:MAG: hypothetical protein J5858_16495 [Lentisphaeria bacterium]|nr:hypothetical protein [Lentisphaeria bacterium]